VAPKRKVKDPSCALCGTAGIATSLPGLLEHVPNGKCRVGLFYSDGVCADDRYELDDGTIYDLQPVEEAPPGDPKPMAPLSGEPDVIDLDQTPIFTTVEEALRKIFEANKLEYLGGTSGARGWSSVSTFAKCPYLWEHTFLGKRRVETRGLAEGSLVHIFLASYYQGILQPDYPITSEYLLDALHSANVNPEYLTEAWRVFQSYLLRYPNDVIEPLAVEHLVVDPRSGRSCRFDLIFRVTKTVGESLLAPGTYLMDHKCITGDSLIFDRATKKLVRVDDLFKFGIGPRVLAYRDGKLVEAQAEAPEADRVRPVYKVQLSDGHSLRCSDDHPILTASGWVKAADLTENHWVAIPSTTSIKDFRSSFTDAQVRIVGMLLGDGSLTHAASFSQLPGPHWDLFLRTAAELGEAPTVRVGKRNVFVATCPSKKGAPVDNLIRSLGLHGCRSHDKHIPIALKAIPDRQVGILLGALWDTDGNITTNENRVAIRYTSVSKRLVEDIQYLCLRLGIHSRISKTTGSYAGSPYDYYNLTVSTRKSKRVFLGLLLDGVINSVRVASCAQQALENVKEGDDRSIPLVLIASALERGPKTQSISNNLSKLKREPSASVTWNVANEWVRNIPELREILDRHIHWIRVLSVSSEGSEMLYHISVPGPNTFVVNDIITHNTLKAFYESSLEWRNDGTILTQLDLWHSMHLDKKFGKLTAAIVNVLGKQKDPKFERILVPPVPRVLKDHRKHMPIWIGQMELAKATGVFPRNRAVCTMYGLCELYNHCAGDADL
jgi:intein/homing endonuclease